MPKRVSKPRPSQDRLKELFHYDPETGVFTRRKPSAHASENPKYGAVGAARINEYGYAMLMIDGKNYIAGSLAWLYVYGEWPPTKIRYLNAVKTDNRIANIGIYVEKREDMESRKLTLERLKELLHYEPETGWFTWRINSSMAKVGDRAGGGHGLGYRAIGLDYRKYLEHTLAWLYMTGEWPVTEIDHINQNKSDNRWSNLRHVTRSENNRNKGKAIALRNSLGFPGVYKLGRKYRGSITVDFRTIVIGWYETVAEARVGRLLKEKEVHGDFTTFEADRDGALPFGDETINVFVRDGAMFVVDRNSVEHEITDAKQIEALFTASPTTADG